MDRIDPDLPDWISTGRKSGEQRTLPLIYGRHGDRHVLVASKGGHRNHPSWHQNLVDQPEVEVQVGADVFRARARTAEGRERQRLWETMRQIWPQYDDYQAATDREIPVVVLERV